MSASVGTTNRVGAHVADRREAVFYPEHTNVDYLFLDEAELKSSEVDELRKSVQQGHFDSSPSTTSWRSTGAGSRPHRRPLRPPRARRRPRRLQPRPPRPPLRRLGSGAPRSCDPRSGGPGSGAPPSCGPRSSSPCSGGTPEEVAMGIVVRDLCKSFGAVKVVDHVSFEIPSGQITALLGPSGGGKSTVLRMIAGLEVPDAGEVVLNGVVSTKARVQERAVGFVFQHYALFRHMTVRQNIAFGLSVRGRPRAEIDAAVRELLELVQLGTLGDRYPDELSGGQRQRVALARALAPRPSLLLLDEPFGALDAKVRMDLREWIRRLHREREITSVFVTHDQEEAIDLADRVIVLHKGCVEQIGTPEEIYDLPATEFVASFVGASNVLQGEVKGGAPRSAPWR